MLPIVSVSWEVCVCALCYQRTVSVSPKYNEKLPLLHLSIGVGVRLVVHGRFGIRFILRNDFPCGHWVGIESSRDSDLRSWCRSVPIDVAIFHPRPWRTNVRAYPRMYCYQLWVGVFGASMFQVPTLHRCV
jgi:hypothetical protein